MGKEKFWDTIKQFVYGMAAHDTTRFALKTRGSMEHLFILITMLRYRLERSRQTVDRLHLDIAEVS